MKKSPVYDTNRPEFQTPMMIQYMELKAKYPDCILFFRLGDFYEMFLDDAVTGSKILGITLTRRSRGKDGAIPMAGVPYHAVDLYLPKLVNAGHKVAIAEQITSPKDTPNLVVRDVIRIVTPGTMIEGRSVNEKESAFVCVLHTTKKDVTIAYADLATGEFYVKPATFDQLDSDLHQIAPKELIIAPQEYNNPQTLGKIKNCTTINISSFSEWTSWQTRAQEVLTQQLQVKSLNGFGLDTDSMIEACGVLYGYLAYTQHGQLAHVRNITRIEDNRFLHLDTTTIESLEILQSSMDKQKEGSLLYAIDQTQTAMGARLLKRWLLAPLCESQSIQQRLNNVEWFTQSPSTLETVRHILAQITDIERQLSKLAVGMGNARDLVSIRTNLELVAELSQLEVLTPFANLFASLKVLSPQVRDYIAQWIEDDPPGVTKIGGIIKKGNHRELDAYRATHHHAEQWIRDFEESEKLRTGINMLKVGFNSVFGFYIEISKTNAHLVKDSFGYDRKQTLVNAERFITPELKNQETKVLAAKEKADELEYELFTQVVNKILQYSTHIQTLAQHIAYLDCIVGFAYVALSQQYTKPQLTQEKILNITNGRHPVVEQYLHDQFVPNSTDMDVQKRMMLLTGPNMAGKSTYIRQVALIVLLTHVGSFVPADQALIPVCDRIFSRIGASDALHKGLSTFMVEMTETAKILRQMSDKSLVIFDEIGRGTGISDGMSIAQAIAEYVAVMPQHPFVFFATHYHELAELAQEFPSIINSSMAVQIHKNKMIFLRTLQAGSTANSYGVEVAQQAGVPLSIIKRAEILREQFHHLSTSTSTNSLSSNKQALIDSVKKQISALDLDQMTPRQALEFLYKVKKDQR